jgi:hypothetical protein
MGYSTSFYSKLRPVHKIKFDNRVKQGLTEVTRTKIVKPVIRGEVRYVLIRGWKAYHCARVIKQEKIAAYITRSTRQTFAKKLMKIEEEMKIEKEIEE